MADHDTSRAALDSVPTPLSEREEVDEFNETLDPEDWEHYRRVSHQVLDELLDYLQTVPRRPVWRPVPRAVKERLREPPPHAPLPVTEVWDAVRELILPYPTGNIHPRFWGWVHGTGTASGVLAEMIAATMNSNLGGREHAPVYVERQVIDWFRALFGFPVGASGILLTGTSMATAVGLAVARNAASDTVDVRRHGVAAVGRPLGAYAAAEAHGSARKALELLGLGADAVHVVPVGPDFRMDVDALRRAIAGDRALGRLPFCVVGTAGTVNTGAIDDLDVLADVCAAEGVWFHVDGAFGAMAALSASLRPLVAGIERADSLAFDFHKWLHVPYAAGCLLVRDGARHRAAFSVHQSYLTSHERGLAGGSPWFCDYGPDLSRGFAALKVWFTLKEHGLDRLGAMVRKNCRQAAYLAERVAGERRLELLAPVSLNVVCFRYARPGADAAWLDRVNEQIIYELHERGVAAPSSTRIHGALAIRACLTNHRTRRPDLDALVDAVCAAGDRLAGGA